MLQFVRQIPIQIVFEKALSERRGFLFYLAAGFTKDVDPLSGMTVNLVIVDQWLQKLKAELEESIFITDAETLNHAFAEVMAVIRLNLAELAESEQAELVSVTLREERGWTLSWDESLSPEVMRITRSHYIEMFSPSGFDLVQLKLNWQRASGCEADYGHEGFLLLKRLNTSSSDEFMESLKVLVGTALPSKTILAFIEVHYPALKYSIVIG